MLVIFMFYSCERSQFWFHKLLSYANKIPNVLDCGLFKYIMYTEAGTLNTFYILMVGSIWAVKNNFRRNDIS